MIPIPVTPGKYQIFLYGTLTDRDVLARILARTLSADELEAAWLDEFRRVRALGASYPLLVPSLGAEVPGLLLRSAARADIARLNHFESCEYWAERHVVRLEDGSACNAWLYAGLPTLEPSQEPWDLATWQREHKAAFLAQCDAWMADCPEPG
jgi:gamma-glutamylcyclotransferase (GGCT)/AIG2-like uncharacterized protein YtfP